MIPSREAVLERFLPKEDKATETGPTTLKPLKSPLGKEETI